MDNEFLTDEFFLKLIRLGVELPENRVEIRKVLATLDAKRKEASQALDRTPEEQS